MVIEHRLVSPQVAGVLRRATEHLDPPPRHVIPVRLVDAAREERTEQVVALDPVVEGVDQPAERNRPTGPVEQRRRAHAGEATAEAVASPAVAAAADTDRATRPPRFGRQAVYGTLAQLTQGIVGLAFLLVGHQADLPVTTSALA